jgi:hypothetical protein
VGAGFAMAAKLCKPEAEVWIIYGDGKKKKKNFKG